MDIIQDLLKLVSSLTSHLAEPDRYQRIIELTGKIIPSDASIILKLNKQQLIPLAWRGLSPEIGGQVLDVDDHPRLKSILLSAKNKVVKPTRFPKDSLLPDPWDGLLLSDPNANLKIHACMGCPLIVNNEIVGLLSVDSLNPNAFDNLEDDILNVFANIAASAIYTAGLVDNLESKNFKQGIILERLNSEAEVNNPRLIGKSEAMLKLYQEIEIASTSELSTLILGETGVGKELVAKSIHAQSNRSKQTMIHFNCATITESLAESQLFGHRKGSFTGAIDDHIGIFEMADGGTVFLDEIGELPLSIQPKLLRVLQQGEFQKIGDSKTIKVDIRIIAATNRDLELAQQNGTFRSDLYYRLAIFPLKVPPLRDRYSDIPLITGSVLQRESKRLGAKSLRLAKNTRDALVKYEWPGNVRELEHILMRASVCSFRRFSSMKKEDGIITVDDIALPNDKIANEPNLKNDKPQPKETSLREQQDAFTHNLLKQIINKNTGNLSAAARELKIAPSNLQRLAKRLKLV